MTCSFLNIWIPIACKIPGFLAGYWDEYPLARVLFLLVSFVQCFLAIGGMGWYYYKSISRFYKEEIKLSTCILPNRVPFIGLIVIPFLTMFREAVLGLFGVSLVLSWISSPSMLMNYIQAQVDLYLFVLRFFWIGFSSSKWLLKGCFVWTGISFFLLYTTSNPKVQGILGGTVILTDPMALFVFLYTGQETLAKLREINFVNEYGNMALSWIFFYVFHMIFYYVPLFLPSVYPSFQYVAEWLVVFGILNLLFFCYYVWNLGAMWSTCLYKYQNMELDEKSQSSLSEFD